MCDWVGMGFKRINLQFNGKNRMFKRILLQSQNNLPFIGSACWIPLKSICCYYFQALLDHLLFGYGPFNEEPTSQNHHCPGQVIQRQAKRAKLHTHINANEYDILHFCSCFTKESRSIMLAKNRFLILFLRREEKRKGSLISDEKIISDDFQRVCSFFLSFLFLSFAVSFCYISSFSFFSNFRFHPSLQYAIVCIICFFYFCFNYHFHSSIWLCNISPQDITLTVLKVVVSHILLHCEFALVARPEWTGKK